MSTTISFAQYLLSMGQRYLDLGRTSDAFTILTRLAKFRELPTKVAEEAHACLGRLHIQRKNLKRARHHVQTALKHEPNSARYHYMMASALRSRNEDRRQKATQHYARAIELNPADAEAQSDYGLHLVRLGKTAQGVEHLRKGWDQSEGNPQYLSRLLKGLRLAGRMEEARTLLRSAMFQYRQDRRFRKIWHDFRYYEARKEMLANQRAERAKADKDPVILRFQRVSVESETGEVSEKLLRYDDAGHLNGPHRPIRSSDHRNVQ